MNQDVMLQALAESQTLPDETIIRNSIRTPDGTQIESRHRHHFNSHIDANGNSYAVDGGRSYLRRVFDVDDFEPTSVHLYDGHEIVRQAFTWGTRGPDGKQEVKYVRLCDMDDDHLQNIINDGYNTWPLMQAELDWRRSAASRKVIRKRDIERLQRVIKRYPSREEVLLPILEDIVEKFNNNEFD